MPSQHRKHRGYASQRIVADHLRANGFPHAQPVGAGRSGSDITGVYGLDIEVKARRGFNPSEALKQLAERAAEGVMGVVVLRLDGQGPASIEEWPVVMRLGDVLPMLRSRFSQST